MSQPESRKIIPSALGASAEAEAFRDVIRHLASGVTIITSSLGGEPVGLTATAVCSVSAMPPMLLVSLTATSRTAKGVAETGAFAVHLLPHTGRRYAEQFASRSSHFQDVKYSPTPDRQIPLLPNALGWFLCQAEQSLRVADHVIFVGRVLQCELKDKSPDPLVYFDRNYRKLAPAAEHATSTLEPWGSAQDAGLPGFGW
jgi:flavin reductase (DIM6/NTAB) family NADH-FMN oxidoreductase RutF